MAKAKKASTAKKPINDVAHPGTTAPSDTSKPIITHRPMIKDPMVVEEKSEKTEDPLVAKTRETKIIPPSESTKEEASDKKKQKSGDEPVIEIKLADEGGPEKNSKKPEPPVESKAEEPGPEKPAEAEPETETPEEDAETETDATDKKSEKSRKSIKAGLEAEAAASAAQSAKLQKLVESKQYFLPINAVEHRRSKRVVIVGVVLALLLALAWVDIALDAGLVEIDGVKPVTHFFSN